MNEEQTLVIHKFEALFNILHEVKSVLNFKIKQINTDKFDQNSNENYLIISKAKNLSSDNQILIKNYPLSLSKLIEIININFLKKQFNQQNNIKIGNYIINLNSRIMIREKSKLSLTEKEAKIIIFLNNFKIPRSITDLQKEVWGHKSKLETHTVETHIYRLRKKIEKKFQDKNFISSFKAGYQINA